MSQISEGEGCDYLTRGELFGEKHLLSSRRVHQVAKTVSPVKVVVLRKAEFFRHLRRDRRFAQQVVGNLVLRMERYEETKQSETLPLNAPIRRLALALFRLAPTRPASGWLRLPCSPTNPS
jgi:CRP-like cAMP-binding protein